MSNSLENSALLEFAVKELKNENVRLKDEIETLSKNEIQTREDLLNLQSEALEAAANGIAITDVDGNLLWVNNAFSNLTGYKKEEVINQNPRVLKSDLQDEEYYKNLWNTISSGKIWQGELINKRKDGTNYTEEMTITPVKDKNGIIINYIAIKQDISKQKAIREIENLVLSTNSLENLLSGIHKSINQIVHSPNFYIALYDEISGIVSFPYFADQSDPKPEPRMQKKGLTEYIINSKKHLRLTLEIYDKLIAQKKIEQIGTFPESWIGIPLIINGKSSGALVIQSYDKNIVYDDYDLNWLVSIAYIISTGIDRIKTHLKTQENERKISAIAQSTKDAIITIDEETNIVFWNKAAENLFGYQESEAVKDSLLSLLIPERCLTEVEKKLKNFLTLGKDVKGTLEFITRRKDGTEIEIELTGSPTEINNLWFITGIFREISSRKILENTSSLDKDKIIASLKDEIENLKSDNNILNNLINAIPQRIYVKDKNHRFLKVNQALLDFHNYESAENFIGKTDFDLFEKTIAESFVEEEKVIMNKGYSIADKEHQLFHKGGKETWAQTSKFPLSNLDGKVIGTFGITTEITERKKMELELIDNQYRFRELIENSTLGILRLDENGEIIMTNPAFIEMLGYNSQPEIISKNIDRIYHNLNNRKKFLQILNREGKISCFEDKMIKNDQSLIDVKESAWTIKDHNGKFIYFEVIIEDITEQNKVLKVLHESEFKYRTLLDKLDEAVFLIINDKYELVNSKFLQIFGLSEDEVYNPNFDLNNYLTEESKEVEKKRKEKMQNGEEVSKTYSLKILTKEGDEREVEISYSYLNFNGKTAMQGIMRDLTEMKKQETQIRHLQKMEAIGTLAAGIAHEINTPAQFINDNLSFLQNSYGDIKPLFDFVENIEENENFITSLSEIVENADLKYLQEEIPNAIDQSLEGIQRIASIVGAMRDFSHTGPKDKISADLHRIIENSITLSKNSWKYISEIETDFDEAIQSIVCQPNDLNQVFINMIVNSSHAMEEKFADCDSVKGKILIKTIKVNEKVEIHISDNGKGMSDIVLKRIYDPFFTTKDVGKGTGQGLSIAYDIIVTKHSGAIEVKSEEGIGTQFKITLPIDGSTEVSAV